MEIKDAWDSDGTNSMACIEVSRCIPKSDANDCFWNLRQEMEILLSPSPTAWGLLKASVEYDEYPDGAFAFQMAGKELGFLKAWSIEWARTISPLFYTSMKLKSIKHIPVEEHDED